MTTNLSIRDVGALIGLLGSPAGLLDCNGRVIRCNPAFHDMIAPGHEAAVGRSVMELVDNPSDLRRYLDQADRLETRVLTLTLDGHAYAFQIGAIEIEGCRAFLLNPAGPGLNGRRMRHLMDRLAIGFWDFDVSTNTFRVTDAWRRIRGMALTDPVDVSDHTWTEAIHPDDRATLLTVFETQKRGDLQHVNIQYRHWNPEREWVWIFCRASVLEVDAEGSPTRIVGVDTEISDLKEKEAEAQDLAGKLQLAIDVAGLGIWEFDPNAGTVHWDDRMLDLYGVTDGQNERGGDFWETHLHPEDRNDLVAYAEDCQKTNRDFMRDYRILRCDGETRHVRSLARYVDLPPSGPRLIGVNIDVTGDYLRTKELEAARRQLEYDSLHDALTGLGNRRHLDETFDGLLDRIAPTDDYAVALIDLDHFKAINDDLGHAAGDAVLVRVAQTLKQRLGPLGQAFRVGGDEFVALFHPAPRAEAMDRFCAELIGDFAEPFEYEGHIRSFGGSIGYAHGRGQPKKRSDVFIHADTALYAAKRAGKSCYRSYDQVLQTPFVQQEIADAELSHAIESGEVVCLYQPQFNARTREVQGAEALVRWHSLTRGRLAPDQFIERARQAGYLSAIDARVFEQVLAQQTAWHEAGLPVPRISVNVSNERLRDPGLNSHLRDWLRPHHKLSFELLETTMLDQIESNLRFSLDALREMDVRLELDDFGSGHSSVLALHTVQPDRVKIDGRLVALLTSRDAQADLLNALSRIARIEGAEVILEGVGTADQLAAVAAVDCDALQGFALARPMPAAEFARLFQAEPALRTGAAQPE